MLQATLTPAGAAHSNAAGRGLLRPAVAQAVAAMLAGAALLAPAAQAGDCGLDAARLESIHAIDKAVVDRGFAPGIVTSIYCEGRPVLTHAHGLADAARQQAITPEHLFRIYSMTKPVTSVAAMILADEGKLGLDDPVARFIPEFGTATVYDAAQPGGATLARAVTVRDLLRHTAGVTYRGTDNAVQKMYVKRGIDNGGGAVVVPEDDSKPVAGLGEMASRIAGIPLLGQPGERFTYGNSTDVLGRVVEVASGQSLGAFMDERIFKPLEMRDTSFVVSAGNQARLSAAYWAKSAAKGDARILKAAETGALERGSFSIAEDPTKSVFAKPRGIEFGGAGLVSSAADYQRFLQMLLAGGSAGGKRIVSAAAVAEMTRNQLPETALANPQMVAQGLGFGLGFATIVDPAKAPAPVSPSFYFWGGAASTYFWVDPERRLSGVVMTQVFGGDVSAFYVDILKQAYPPAPVKTAAAATPQNIN
ncbi:serine hydrolase domain-containing protein [Massilia glaciei]|uniref:serine hydrolase domain-containing protein n=1 Tax=Massilia glaciei TaxID=1524097 RepID=UPI0011B29610|nr:serine hydrolase domain-containing protein [Massilia glaciei]